MSEAPTPGSAGGEGGPMGRPHGEGVPPDAGDGMTPDIGAGDSRGPGVDGDGDIGNRVERDDTEFMRQPALVDDVDRAAILVDPDGAVVAVCDFHATVSFSMRAASALISSRPWMRSRLTQM